MGIKSLKSGGWFDPSECEKYEEGTRWNGSNRISLATGSQWEHEVLYVTPGGRFILHRMSDWQGRPSYHEEIPAEEAAAWLVRNELVAVEDDGSVVTTAECEEVRPEIAEAVKELKVE